MRYLLALLVGLLAITVSAAADDDRAVTEYDQTEMHKAIERAKSEVDEFIGIMKSGKADMVSVKVPITEGDNVEHFWLSDLRLEGDTFIGVIDNKPDVVKNVKEGDERKVKKGEISDWMYIKNGKMYGNYTLRVLMKSMPKDEADQLRKRFQLDD